MVCVGDGLADRRRVRTCRTALRPGPGFGAVRCRVVIDHVLLGTSRRSGDLKTHKVFGEHDERDQQQALEQPGDEHASIRKHANGRFSGQAFRGGG